MKKVSIVLLLVAIMVLSMTGCSFAPSEVVEAAPAEVIGSGTLQYEAKGTYNISKVGADMVVYRFESPNDDIVVYEIPGTIFLVGENINKKSVSYAANMFVRDGEFVALSDKYLLFATPEGNGMKAVAIDAKSNNSGCAGLMLEYSFDDLSEEEKDAFVYPAEIKATHR